MNTVNTEREITSWITFSWTSEKGPPLPTNPILFAGTWQQYSKRAMPQLMRIIAKRERPEPHFVCENLRCPYQAMVMKLFDTMSKRIVQRAFIALMFRILSYSSD